MTTMTVTTAAPDLATAWKGALSFDDFVSAASAEHRPLWESIRRTCRIPEEALIRTLPPGTRLLALAADWCGDAVNTLPALSKWTEAIGVELRLLDRDMWPEVMDHYLTDGARAIPIIIALGPDLTELGHWGPRPRELQDWVSAHRSTMDKEARYKEIRRWYAKDRGATTIREITESVRGNRTA